MATLMFDTYSIRPLKSNDLENYYKLVENNRQRLEDFFAGTFLYTRTISETKKFIDKMVSRAKERSYFPYIIMDKSNGNFAGFIDLKNIDWSIPKLELGCYIDKDYTGKGIATSAVSLFCDYCFDHYKVQKIFLRTHQSNTSAISVAENCGFELEGVIRKDYRTSKGQLMDLRYYGKVR
jgi:RimJ/RimL family protein N-acetyltransferase